MKGILINAATRTITKVEVPEGYKNIYPFLGEGVDMFQCVDISKNGDTIYIDEEGLLKPQDNFFLYKGYGQPLAGNGLVLGTDNEGESQNAQTKLETIINNVTFMNRHEAHAWAVKHGV